MLSGCDTVEGIAGFLSFLLVLIVPPLAILVIAIYIKPKRIPQPLWFLIVVILVLVLLWFLGIALVFGPAGLWHLVFHCLLGAGSCP